MFTKDYFSILSIILVFIAYIPYVIETYHKKIQPHLFSWFIWGFITSIIYLLQSEAGAGFSSIITLIISLFCFTVFIISLKNGDKNIAKVDYLFLLAAIIAIFFWLVEKQPVTSIIILCTIDMLAFAPTVRKSWIDPFSENLPLYTITVFRQAFNILALEKYNIVTLLFPSLWVVANFLFAIMLIIRRINLKKKLT